MKYNRRQKLRISWIRSNVASYVDDLILLVVMLSVNVFDNGRMEKVNIAFFFSFSLSYSAVGNSPVL
jgi:hypothetical protein